MEEHTVTLYFWGTEEECQQLIELSKTEDKSISVLYSLIYSELDDDDLEEFEKDPSYILDYQSKWDCKGLSTSLEPVRNISNIFVLKITTTYENLIEAKHLKESMFMDNDLFKNETVYYLTNTAHYQVEWVRRGEN